jgi:hypothetical protein
MSLVLASSERRQRVGIEIDECADPAQDGTPAEALPSEGQRAETGQGSGLSKEAANS